MVKGAAAGPGVYSATYSNIPVWEYQFGVDLKEHVMRRRYDDYINATHILKAAGFDKPARTRILEREVQKGEHEKVQGGYGKYQGTWVPLNSGAELARRNGVYDKLATIFEFVSGNVSPPPAPKHTTSKPKAPKKPAVPKFNTSEKHFPKVFPDAHYLPIPGSSNANEQEPVVAPAPMQQQRMIQDEDIYDAMSVQYNNEDQTPDDTTVASFIDDDRYDQSAPPTGRKRKRSPPPPALSQSDQAHIAYSDELLDYFMLSQASEPASRPEPPPNFNPDWTIDSEGHTALHWAAAMGDLDVMKQLRTFGANIDARNLRGETPLMRATLFTNCMDKNSMPRVVQELISTIASTDQFGSTAIHHAANLTCSRTKHHCARYYLDVILNKMTETMPADEIRAVLDKQDTNGATACHIAADNKARKCLRALMGRGASTDIPDIRGIRVESLIAELNEQRRVKEVNMSSSPFGPDSSRRNMSLSYPEPLDRTPRTDLNSVLVQARREAHHSEAAQTVANKITPAIVNKFQDLARSFDEELKEREGSEREARRILSQSQMELAGVQREIQQLTEGNEDEAPARQRNELNQLQHAQQRCISLVEQQQAILLSSLVSQKESKMPVNGVNGDLPNDDGTDEVVSLLEELVQEQEKRQHLVQEYVTALADRGTGEMAERYRMLTAKCVGMKEEEVDLQIDALLEVLEEDAGDESRARDEL